MSKVKCRKYKNDHISFLPGIGLLIQQINTYRWIQRYKSGEKCNVRNMERACRRLYIEGLSQMSLDQAKLEVVACIEELKAKKDQAFISCVWNTYKIDSMRPRQGRTRMQ